MTVWPCSLRLFAGRQVVLTLAGMLSVTLSALGQSSSATLPASCSLTDQQIPLAERYPASIVTDSERIDAQVAAIESVIQKIRGMSFPELAKVDLRVSTFHSQSDYFE